VSEIGVVRPLAILCYCRKKKVLVTTLKERKNNVQEKCPRIISFRYFLNISRCMWKLFFVVSR